MYIVTLFYYTNKFLKFTKKLLTANLTLSPSHTRINKCTGTLPSSYP